MRLRGESSLAMLRFTSPRKSLKRNPATLVMNFTAPVNPMIATEPGKLHMVFSREPVVGPRSPSLTFGDSTSLRPAMPKTTAPPRSQSMEPRRCLPASAMGIAPSRFRLLHPYRSPLSAPRRRVTGAPPAQTAAPVAANPSAPQFFAVVDASHGGDERGEAISDQLAEKDITLAFSRGLRQQLQARGLNTLVLRDNDATLTPISAPR